MPITSISQTMLQKKIVRTSIYFLTKYIVQASQIEKIRTRTHILQLRTYYADPTHKLRRILTQEQNEIEDKFPYTFLLVTY